MKQQYWSYHYRAQQVAYWQVLEERMQKPEDLEVLLNLIDELMLLLLSSSVAAGAGSEASVGSIVILPTEASLRRLQLFVTQLVTV
jgi:hypothetical protein